MTRAAWHGITELNGVAQAVAAEAYARAGIPVFPLYGIVPNPYGGLMCECTQAAACDRPGKHPRVRWTREATADVDTVREWWTLWPSANVGIPTSEASGLTVVDLDRKETEYEHLVDIVDGEDQFTQFLERELGPGAFERLEAEALVARTGSGGKHVVLRHVPGSTLCTGWLPAVDLKSTGGYLVAAPSLHASGRRYRWLSENAPAAVEGRLADAIRLARPTGRGGRGGSGDGSGSGDADAPDYDYRQAKRTGPTRGTRDEFFNRYAFELRKRGWDRAAAVAELRRLWEATPGGGAPSGGDRVDPYRWDTVLEKVQRVWSDVTVDPDGREPVADELLAWARGGSGTDSRVGDGDSRADASGPPGGDGGGGGARTGGPVDGTEDATELGMALRTGRVLGDRVRYVHGMGWFVRDGVHWRLDERDYVTHLLVTEVYADVQRQANAAPVEEAERWTTWLHGCKSSRRVGAILRLTQSVPSLALVPGDLDVDPWVLATRSGVLDLRTGLLLPDDEARAAFCTRVADVDWDPDAECPEWLRHTQTVAARRSGARDPELESFLQRWTGYTLTGLVDEQKFAFLYGDGNNGKNVFIETLMGAMGSYAMTQSAKLLNGNGQEHETIIADLAGPRLVFVDETPKGRINEARVKQLTGANRIRARRIARDSFEFDAKFKLWIAGNHKPRVADTSEGLWRRLDLVPFDATIPPERRVKNYARVLVDAEGPGILRYAVEGLRAYRELGLAPPDRVSAAKRVYREEENLFGQFASETFALDVANEDDWVWHPNPVLHGLYEAWCQDNGVKYVQSMQQLANDLEQLHFRRESKTRRIRTALGGARVVRGWWGPPLAVEVPGHLAWTQ